MGVNEARDFVQSKSQDYAKKLALGAFAVGISKIPGATEGYQLIKEKVPKGFSASYDPNTGKGGSNAILGSPYATRDSFTEILR